MSYDWKSAAQMLAGDNARLCTIALAADELVTAVEAFLEAVDGVDRVRRSKINGLIAAYEAYHVAKQGT